MKKYLFLLLFVSAFASAQVNPQKIPKLAITANVTDNTATKVNVQDANGVVNTIAKADLIEVIEYASAINLPVTGVAGKIYVTIDSGRLYRWNGTIYTEISTGGVTSISGLNGVTVMNPTTTPIIGLGDITPTTVTTNSATLTPVTAPSYAEGKVFYDSMAKTLVAYDDISGTSTNLGQELNLRARNNTGVTIPNGSVVYISGATGQNPTIALARANSLSTSVTIGIATHDILNNTVGKITTFGLVNELNTSAFTDGQILYVSPTTAGVLTSTIPTSPNYTAYVCVVLHSHVTQGKIFVRPEQPISLNTALTDNNNTSPSVSAVKSYIDTGLSSKISGSGTIGTLPKFTSSGTLGNSQITDNGSLISLSSPLDVTGIVTIRKTSNAAQDILRINRFNGISMFKLAISEFDEASLSFKNDNDVSLLTINRGGGIIVNGNIIGNLLASNSLGIKRNLDTNFLSRFTTSPGDTFGDNYELQTFLDVGGWGSVLKWDRYRVFIKALPLGGKFIIGSDINNGIDQLQVPNGTISALPATLSNQVVVKSQLDLKANIASPTFTGVPSVPTATAGTNTTQIASTAFVSSAVGVSASKWTQTGNNISNNNTGNVIVGNGAFTVTPVGNVTANYIYPNTIEGGRIINLTGVSNTSALFNYSTDISSSYTDRSFTDKGYVDKKTPAQLKDFYSDVNTVGLTETDLLTYTTLASRLNAAGEKIISVYAGTMNDVTASSQLKAYFAGTLIADTGALTMSVTGAWVINASIIRTGATTARSIVNISTPGASTASYTKYTSLTGLTFTNTNILKVTGTAAGATGGDNDITATYGNILWQPAAL